MSFLLICNSGHFSHISTKTDVDGKLNKIPVKNRTRMVRVVMARMWQTLSTRITLTRIQMIQHRNRRIKIFNANRLTRLGCVQVAQKIILFVSNSAHQAWICYIFIHAISGFWYNPIKWWKSNKKMAQQNTEDVYASRANALGLLKIKHVRLIQMEL